jgi:hypothetical protein
VIGKVLELPGSDALKRHFVSSAQILLNSSLGVGDQLKQKNIWQLSVLQNLWIGLKLHLAGESHPNAVHSGVERE